jgi:hypothetical protein
LIQNIIHLIRQRQNQHIIELNVVFIDPSTFLLTFNTYQSRFLVMWRHYNCPMLILKSSCYNPSLGLTTKAKACKGEGQKWSPRITFHAPKNVRECEGMNPHTPKWACILGIGISMQSQIYKKGFQELKLIGLNISLHHWKVLRT